MTPTPRPSLRPTTTRRTPISGSRTTDEREGARLGKARNAETVAGVCRRAPAFTRCATQILEVLDSDARIPFVGKIGAHYYNFWQRRGAPARPVAAHDARRVPQAAAALGDRARPRRAGGGEKENWVWHGARVPEARRTSAAWSRCRAAAPTPTSSASSTSTTKAFVKDGFYVPEAKSQRRLDDATRVFVGTDFGPGSLTTSGYPRIVKEWKRGTPLRDGDDSSTKASPRTSPSARYRDLTPGLRARLRQRALDFYQQRAVPARRDGKLVKIDKPDDANVASHREWLLLQLRTRLDRRRQDLPPARCSRRTSTPSWPASATSTCCSSRPTRRRSPAIRSTRHHLILNVLDNVDSRLDVLTPAATATGSASRSAARRRSAAIAPCGRRSRTTATTTS